MSFLEQLNRAQAEAVKDVNGPVMIVAGAGSGKTRVLTYRAAYLVQLGVRPENILALTFTNKAANEMKERIVALVGPKSKGIWMGTFHSIFARILRHECEHLGYTRNFTIYDADDSLSLIKRVMESLNIPLQQFNPRGIRSKISGAKNQMIMPAEYEKTAFDPMGEKTAAVYREYQKRLKKSNAMDFDDLLLKPLELFSRNPEILERYHYRFKYILVDEYQDTNRVQYLLIKELAKLNRNITVVGDDAQSIYAFRGADIRNILDFEKDYPDSKIHRLEQNYRSTQTILSAAHSVIKNNTDQIPKKLWTDNKAGEQVFLSVCDDETDEGYKIVSMIEEETRKRGLGFKDFAVLYRTNAQSRAIEDALRRSTIPYVLVGGVSFYKRKEVKDVLAYLKVVANPRDTESLLRIINYPARAIGETTVKKLQEIAWQRSITIFEALTSNDVEAVVGSRGTRAVRNFRTLIAKYIELKQGVSASELARSLVDELGILISYKAENTHESLERRDNVLELLSALTEFNDLNPGAGLEDFLEEVSLVSDIDLTEFGRNAVTLMTLHAAKGLEFPIVLISGLEEGLFPLSDGGSDRKELEEERRLFYVGITRAMEQLYLSYAVTRYRYGELTYSVKSRFLDEIDPEYVKTEERATRRTPGIPYRRKPEAGTIVPPRVVINRKKTRSDAEPFFPDQMPNYEDESQERIAQRVGSRVVHESFGAGRIISIDGRGDNARAVVDFESVGRKHLMLKFAQLRTP